MNAIRFRFAFALLIAGVLSLAGAAEWSRRDRSAWAETAAPAPLLEGTAEAGSGGGGEPVEVRWTSLIPGTFK